jgi:hypothetical protein
MTAIAENTFTLNDISLAGLFAFGGIATATTSLTVMTSDQTQTVFQDSENPTIQQLTAVNGRKRRLPFLILP